MNCPTCNGQKIITTPNGANYQQCPTCGGSGSDPGEEIPFDYVFDITAAEFTTLIVKTSIGVTTLGEADFIWKAFAASTERDGSLVVPADGWRVRFGFGGGGYMSSGGQGSTNDRVRAELIAGTGQFPVPIWPHVRVPRGGKILFDLESTSGSSQAVHMRFIGALVYPSR
jgi:hypothetical protein